MSRPLRRVATAADALVIFRRGVQHDSVEVQGLTLAPKVAKLLPHQQRFSGRVVIDLYAFPVGFVGFDEIEVK